MKYFKERKLLKEVQDYDRGFGWACTKYSLYGLTIQELKDKLFDAYFSPHFDKGALTAIRKMTKQEIKASTREEKLQNLIVELGDL